MRVVILGAGTGVGKTYTTVTLAGHLQAAGHSVLALKPVETGFARSPSGQPAAASDAAALERSGLHVKQARPHPLYCFVDPVSPHLAARRANQVIDLDTIVAWVCAAERQQAWADPISSARASAAPAISPGSPTGPVTLIETAGGALSPLNEREDSLDLTLRLAPEHVLLVAADSLGALHNVRATVSACRARGVSPRAVILSASGSPDAASGSHAAELRRLDPALECFDLGAHRPADLLPLLPFMFHSDSR